MGNFSKELQGMAFLLQWIGIRVGETQYFQFAGLDFVLLSLALRLNQLPYYADTASSSQRLGQSVIRQGLLYHHLKIAES